MLGVIGINFISFMVKAKEPATVDDAIDHIDHVRDLVGIASAAIWASRATTTCGEARGSAGGTKAAVLRVI